MSKKTDKKGLPETQKEYDRDRMAKVIDTALQYGATLNEAHLSCKLSGLDVSPKTIERFINEKHNMTFGEYKNYMMGIVRLRIKEKIATLALQGNTALLIFAAKNLCGWADKIENKIEEKPTKELIEQAKELIASYEKEKDEAASH